MRAQVIDLIRVGKLKDVEEFINDASYDSDLRHWVSYNKNLVKDYCTLLESICNREAYTRNQQAESQESVKTHRTI